MGFGIATAGIPYCEDCGGIVRPGVVLYEEGINSEVIGNAVQAISRMTTRIRTSRLKH